MLFMDQFERTVDFCGSVIGEVILEGLVMFPEGKLDRMVAF
jgi:hypothetical protein